MERKIGEIFEYKGEWYQCIVGCHCLDCAFCNNNCEERERITLGNKLTKEETTGFCTPEFREDGKSVIFKKLEKVGEPFYRRWTLEGNNKLMQRYKIYTTPLITIDKQRMFYNLTNDFLEIEIKQNKEDMEEDKLNLKPFDIQKAREGKPVCTRDGRKARIICFDRISGDDYYKIVACVTAFDGDFEAVLFYGIDGHIVDSQSPKEDDLMMLPEKKEGWVNVYNSLGVVTFSHNPYDTKKEALANAKPKDYVDTVKINWEE